VEVVPTHVGRVLHFVGLRMNSIGRTALFVGTGLLIIFLAKYRFFLPQLRNSPMLWVIAVVALVGLALVLKIMSDERARKR
jgi:Co/Zn/Cd efflux system component